MAWHNQVNADVASNLVQYKSRHCSMVNPALCRGFETHASKTPQPGDCVITMLCMNMEGAIHETFPVDPIIIIPRIAKPKYSPSFSHQR
jgi:hypothetical protein